MAELSPDEIADREFRSGFRGYDPPEVRAFLAAVADRLRSLSEERDRLTARLGEFSSRDLATEFQTVGREVSAILESARQAADAMRERAAADAARWRSEALVESESERRRAQADAEQLRGDAWSTAEQLLREVAVEAERIRRDADKESLRLVGEAERESHRITGAARREAEEAVRSARMEGERLLIDAQARHDEMVESARKQAETSQERARALELRRDELKRELDTIRLAISGVEAELDERRELLGLSTPVPVPEPSAPAAKKLQGRWGEGETVRVVRPQRGGDRAVEPAPAEEPAGTVAGVRVLGPTELAARAARVSPAPVSPAPVEPSPAREAVPPAVEPAPVAAPSEAERKAPAAAPEPPAPEPAPEPAAAAPTAEPAPAPVSAFESLAGLFERLRLGRTVEPEAAPVEEAPVSAATESAPLPPAEPMAPVGPPAPRRAAAPVFAVDPFELRERLLMPVSNRALRNLKRQLTEEQNVALEEIRLDEAGWAPQAAAVRSRIRADLVVLLAESFAAGHTAVEELLGSNVPRPATPRHEVADGFAHDLVRELEHAVEEGRAAGHGARQLGATVSRVFRAWRTDEAERRIRDLAYAAYHEGISATIELFGGELAWLTDGRACATCRAAMEVRPDRLPPLHGECGCTVIPA
jgi:DivIVA domain-containing protein